MALGHDYKMQLDGKDENHFELINLYFTVHVVTFKGKS